MTASAAALALYARVAWPWALLGWVALVPWLLALDRVRTLAGALASALAMSVAFALGVFAWFAPAMARFTGADPVWTWLALVLAAPLLQPQLPVYAAARHLARRRGAGTGRVALAGAGAWLAAEWLLPKLFGDTLGHGLHPFRWLRQAADLSGVAGLTALLLLSNECARAWLAAPRSAPPRAAGALAGAVLLLSAYGAVRVERIEARDAEAPRVRVGLVQPNLGRYRRLADAVGTFEAVRRILDAHFELSRAIASDGAALDLLVWPETVYPTTFGAPKSPEGAAFDGAIASFARDLGAPLVFGTYDTEAGHEYNAAAFLDARGGRPTVEFYRKARPFPLTERVPNWLESRWVRRWLPWLGTWRAGEGPRTLPLTSRAGRALRVGPLICYDAVVPGPAAEAARRGAELLLTLSNDSWFDGGGGPRLHLMVSVFRSIETRLAQVRATNTGISAFVSAAGELGPMAGRRERAALVADVPLARGDSPFLHAGNLLGPVGLAGAALALGTGRRQASGSSSAPG